MPFANGADALRSFESKESLGGGDWVRDHILRAENSCGRGIIIPPELGREIRGRLKGGAGQIGWPEEEELVRRSSVS